MKFDLTDAEVRSIVERTPGQAVSTIFYTAPPHIKMHWLEQRAIDLGIRPGVKSRSLHAQKHATPEFIATANEAARVANAARLSASIFGR